jgi:hypothetical protein
MPLPRIGWLVGHHRAGADAARASRTRRVGRAALELLEPRWLLTLSVPDPSLIGGDPVKATGANSVPAKITPGTSQDITLTGRLDPLSDTGPSNSDGVTAINHPTFIGTAQPYAIVQVSVRRRDQAQFTALGQAITDPFGQWVLTVGALPDGVYTVALVETPPTDLPGPPVPLSPNGTIVIDTSPPVVDQVTMSARTGLLTVKFKDTLAGLETATLIDPSRYALTGSGRRPRVPSSVVRTDRRSATLRFDGQHRSLGPLSMRLAGVADKAGNTVDARRMVRIRLT